MRVARLFVSFVLLSSALGAAGCPGGSTDDRIGVVVTPVPPAGVTITRYRVAGVLDEKDSTSGPQEVAPDKTPFTLVLPAGTRGTLRVYMDAADGSSLLVAQGQADLVLGAEKDYQLTVPLERAACGSAFCYDQAGSRDLGLAAVWGTAADDVFAVGQRGAALHFDGFAWQSIESGTQQDLYGVWGNPEGDIRVVGSGGTLIKLGGGQEAADVTQPLRAIWGAAGNDIWAVGGGGVVLHYDGSAWSRGGPDIAAQLYAVWGKGAQDVWVAGERGAVAHWDGSLWTVASSVPTMEHLHAIAGTTADGTVIVGDRGVLLRLDQGAWTLGKSGTTRSLFGLWGGDKLWAAGEAGVVLSGSASGLDGTSVAQTTLYSIWGDGKGTLYAVGDFGLVARFTGGAWAVVHRGPMQSSLRPPRGEEATR